ncbi:DotH/IcmK family type IV secretion protein [Paraburkholderia ferrariae]|jgi:intracellular multiplication protein IcmK|uniref:DotH/IcmK family type IV secretion protein n=1 Tax=Paraburkholderia ferrariae TaxID=386056 RepID=UPI000489FEFC|nr:DotH/IcmK family type IV secretion protein [Paraburkholderia ferrariae]
MKRLALLLVAPLAASTLAPAMAQNAQQPQPQPQPAQQQSAAPAAQGVAAPAPAPQQPQQAQAPQWVNAGAPAGAFPPPPGQAPMSSQQQIQAAFPQTNYGAANYAVAGQAPQGYPQQYPAGAVPQNGVAPMPPLAPPSNYERAEQVVSPFSNGEIVKLRQQLDDSRKAKAYHPVRTVPRISSISVDLSPGAALPIARVLPGEQTTLVFVDSTGAPWPLAVAPRVSDARYFDVEWLQGTPSVVISALSAYEDGNVTVFLQGMATPVVVKLATGEPDSKEKSRVVDYRLDLRVPGRGPNAQAPFLGAGRIALYDDTMQGFLDGIPPSGAKRVTAHGDVPARTQVWQYGDAMFVRTNYDIQTAFDQSMSAADGTRVYRLPPTPYVTLSEMGRSVTLQLDIN